MSDLNNPMRFSISGRTIPLGVLRHDGVPRRVTELDIRPSEGNVYVHWEEADLRSEAVRAFAAYDREEHAEIYEDLRDD